MSSSVYAKVINGVGIGVESFCSLLDKYNMQWGTLTQRFTIQLRFGNITLDFRRGYPHERSIRYKMMSGRDGQIKCGQQCVFLGPQGGPKKAHNF